MFEMLLVTKYIAPSSPYALFGGGRTTTYVNYTDKYTYSDNTVSVGTTLGVARYLLAATGNSTVGIWGGDLPQQILTIRINAHIPIT